MPKLKDLNPWLVGAGGEGITRNGHPVERREGVGLACDCPCGCGVQLFVHFENPIDGKPYDTNSPQWKREGDLFENMTLRPSIKRMNGCKWHGYLTNGVFEGKCEK